MKGKRLKGILFLVVSISLSVPAIADDNDQELARQLTKSGEIVPLDKVIARTIAASGGSVLEAELETENSRYVYELQILMSDGVVWEYRYDARSGELIDKKKER